MKLLPTIETKKRKLPMIGAVLYHGPSELDGEEIVVIVTGLKGSANSKTGKMLQTWIMRADQDPVQASKAGADASVCGDCKHRLSQGGSCYVVLVQAPLAVYRAWKRGRYADWTKAFPVNALENRTVRLGSYGDPAAVPFKVWRRVFAQKIKGWTGYTHQWKHPNFKLLRGKVMASVDTRLEAAAAREAGWRTFRVRAPEAPVLEGEVMCPASDEMANRTTCERCGLCKGQATSAKNIVIAVHGSYANRFAEASR